MRRIKWKTLIITAAITLLPILLGIVLYQELPARMAIHFNIYGEPDRYGNKAFTLFGIPLILTLLQIFCCCLTDLQNPETKGPKVMYITKGIIPLLSIAISGLMIASGLGIELDIRRIICAIIGVIFILIGNYMNKIGYEQQGMVNRPKIRNPKVWYQIRRWFSYTFVVAGILLGISLFFAPIVSFIVMLVLIVMSFVWAMCAWILVKRAG